MAAHGAPGFYLYPLNSEGNWPAGTSVTISIPIAANIPFSLPIHTSRIKASSHVRSSIPTGHSAMRPLSDLQLKHLSVVCSVLVCLGEMDGHLHSHLQNPLTHLREILPASTPKFYFTSKECNQPAAT